MSASTLFTLFRLSFSLAFVFGLIWFAARVVNKHGALQLGGTHHKRLQVLERQPLNRHASVAVVSVDGRSVLVGVTDQQVTLLADVPEPVLPEGVVDGFEVDLDSLGLEHVDLSGGAPAYPTASRRIGTPESHGSPSAWMTFLDGVRERTVRRSS